MLVKEYEVKVSKDKEKNKVLYNSPSLEEKFLKLYNHIKEYEKEKVLSARIFHSCNDCIIRRNHSWF